MNAAPLLFFLTWLNLPLPAERPVTFPGQILSLRQALVQISDQTGIAIAFADDLLEDFDVKPLTQSLTAKEALRSLLAGSSLDSEWVAPDRVVVFVAKPNEFTLAQTLLLLGSKSPLTGATIELLGTWRIARSGADGAYQMGHLPSDQALNLRVSHASFSPIQVHYENPSDIPATLIVEPGPIVNEWIQVQKDRPFRILKPAPYAAQIIQLKDSVVKWDSDLFALSGLVPGAMPQQMGDSGLAIRGNEPGESLYLLDGIKLYQLDHAMGNYSAVPSSVLESTTIYRSGFPAAYGDRMAGVVDMAVKSQANEAQGSASVFRETAAIDVSAPLLGGSFIMAHRRSTDDYLAQQTYKNLYEQTFNFPFEDFSSYEFVQGSQSFGFEDSVAKWSSPISRAGLFSITFYSGSDHMTDDIDVSGEERDYTFSHTQGRWGNQGGSFKWLYNTAQTTTEVQASISRYFTRYQFNDWYGEENGYLRETINSDLREVNYEFRHSQEWGSHRFGAGLFWGKIGSDFLDIWWDGEDNWQASTQINGYFFDYAYQPTSRFGFNAGFRSQTSKLARHSYTDPRYGINWAIDEHWNFSASWGQYHQQILRSGDTIQYFWGIQNWYLVDEDLHPGEMEQWQTSLTWESKTVQFGLELYDKNWRGTLAPVYRTLQANFRSLQEAGQFQGADLWLAGQWRGFKAHLGYGYQNGTNHSISANGRQVGDAYPATRERPHNLNFALSWDHPRWTIGTRYAQSSGLPYGVPGVDYEASENGVKQAYLTPPEHPNNLRLPGLKNLDLSVTHKLKLGTGQLELGLMCTNLTDHRTITYRYAELVNNEAAWVDVYNLPRKLYLNARFQF